MRSVLTRVGHAGALTLLLAGVLFVAAATASPTDPPKITISSPSDGAVVHTATVTVKGLVTVAPYDGPSPTVTATLNGRRISLGVKDATTYDFQASASLSMGDNTLTVVADDGNGGSSTQSVSVRYVKIPPTRYQCVSDRRGDSHNSYPPMDIVRACARRSGTKVIFTVTTASPPPNIHDGFGNPAAPCIEVARPRQIGHSIQTCGDAKLRGWTQHVWPKVPFSISGRVSTWRVPLKYLPRGSFKWRAYLSNGWLYADTAPNKGYLTFVVK